MILDGKDLVPAPNLIKTNLGSDAFNATKVTEQTFLIFKGFQGWSSRQRQAANPISTGQATLTREA